MIFYGIWVDHSQAFLIKANEKDVLSVDHLVSDVDPHHHLGVVGSEHKTTTDEKEKNARRAGQMGKFCEQICGKIMDADKIFVFGPSTAKHDLKHHLETHKPIAKKLQAVESADKMTKAELKEFVRKKFCIE